MEVILSTLNLDDQACDILVTGFFEDERPLRGTSGWVDWRLNGALSRYLIENRLTGAWKETVLIPSQGRILPTLILLIGLGRMKEYSTLLLREILPHILDTLKGLNASKICFCLPEDEEHQIEPGKQAEVLMEGIGDSLDDDPSPEKEEWIRRLQLFYADREERHPEILLGIQTAQSILEDRLKIRIIAPGESGRPSPLTQKDLTFER